MQQKLGFGTRTDNRVFTFLENAIITVKFQARELHLAGAYFFNLDLVNC